MKEGAMVSLERHRGYRRLSDGWFPSTFRMTVGSVDQHVLPRESRFLGSFLHEAKDAVDFGPRETNTYRSFCGYLPEDCDSNRGKSGKRIFSSVKRPEKRFNRAVPQNIFAVFVTISPLFKRLPLAGPEVGLGGVDDGFCFEKENEIRGFAKFLYA